VVESWLHKLYIDRDLPITDTWVHETDCRQRPEMLAIIGYMNVCEDRDQNCG